MKMKTVVNWLAPFLLALSILVSGSAWLDSRTPAQAQNVACYNAQGGALRVAASGCEYEFQSGSTLDVQSGTTETHANDVTFSGVVTLSGTVANSNIEYGAETSVVTQTAIAHTLGTTPTTVLLTPQHSVQFTNTVFVLSSGVSTITVGVEGPGGESTIDTVNWLVAK